MIQEMGRAIFALLVAAPDRPNGTDGRPATVVQHGDQTTRMPFLRVGDKLENPRRPFGRAGREGTVRIHAFSEENGDDECLTLMSWTRDSLDGVKLTIPGFGTPTLLVSSANCSQDPGGEYHAIVTVRAHGIAS